MTDVYEFGFCYRAYLDAGGFYAILHKIYLLFVDYVKNFDSPIIFSQFCHCVGYCTWEQSKERLSYVITR